MLGNSDIPVSSESVQESGKPPLQFLRFDSYGVEPLCSGGVEDGITTPQEHVFICGFREHISNHVNQSTVRCRGFCQNWTKFRGPPRSPSVMLIWGPCQPFLGLGSDIQAQNWFFSSKNEQKSLKKCVFSSLGGLGGLAAPPQQVGHCPQACGSAGRPRSETHTWLPSSKPSFHIDQKMGQIT